MRTMTQKFRDVGLIEMLADAYKNKRNARIGAKILKPESYRVFPDGVVFTCTVLGEVSGEGVRL
ncbi:hypothetical protein [Vibrio campbellii]|uniref:hypothetical protein n=1 Tax=Vibrio campbellii TaxID=680 RepID=UPI002108F3A8|nr:hypothetical protein [Vibrio campbellii]UTZ44579.1 hypothetical protein HB764_25295 [Vibrio campbellii]